MTDLSQIIKANWHVNHAKAYRKLFLTAYSRFIAQNKPLNGNAVGFPQTIITNNNAQHLYSTNVDKLFLERANTLVKELDVLFRNPVVDVELRLKSAVMIVVAFQNDTVGGIPVNTYWRTGLKHNTRAEMQMSRPHLEHRACLDHLLASFGNAFHKQYVLPRKPKVKTVEFTATTTPMILNYSSARALGIFNAFTDGKVFVEVKNVSKKPIIKEWNPLLNPQDLILILQTVVVSINRDEELGYAVATHCNDLNGSVLLTEAIKDFPTAVCIAASRLLGNSIQVQIRE